MARVIVVVPIYAPLNRYETFSLANLNKTLPDADKAIICPVSCTVDFSLFTDNTYQIIRLPDKYFKSPQTYNKLLRTTFFFSFFKEYKYMLMHHIDAFVFRDELEYWCSKDYDYIGAPMYKFDGTISPLEYIGVGNGGFSIHKVESALKVLSTFKIVYPLPDLFAWWINYNSNGRIRYFLYFLRMILGLGRNSHNYLNQSRLNEDVFWGVYVPRSFSWYRVAPFDEALKFSMEYNCEELLSKNNGILPFGSHQWYKGNFLSFWGKYIIK